MDFFASLILAVVGLWLAGRVLRWLFRLWLARRLRDFDGAAGRTDGYAADEARRRQKDGDVTVEQTDAEPAKTVRRDVGEYVEFEEISETETEK